MTDIYSVISKEIKDSDIKFESDVSLAKMTSFKIGGTADAGFFPKSPEEFAIAAQVCTKLRIPFYVMGRGSNLLADDEGFRGAVIFTELLNGKNICDFCVSAMAGVGLTSLSRFVGSHGLSGLEFACGIPGSVGGAVAMNAGAYGGEIADVFLGCTVWNENEGFVKYEKSENLFSYRNSSFLKKHEYVLEARFALRKDSPENIKLREEELLARRREKQPLEYPSAGSAFKRPEGHFAAKLIEESGLKGFRIGEVQISEKHSGFVVNLGNASSSDVRILMEQVKNKVFECFGIELEPEIRYLSPKGEESIC